MVPAACALCRRRNEEERPHLPPPRPLATPPAAQRARAVGPDAGDVPTHCPALSRPGFCASLARGATKPRPLAPGAPRRRSSGAGAELRRRGTRPAARPRPGVGGSADLWAELGRVQRVPGRTGRIGLACSFPPGACPPCVADL